MGFATQALALKFDAMGIVNDAVQYGVAERGIGDNIVPLRDGDLAGDQKRALVVTIVDDFQEVSTLFGGQGLGSPIIDDDEGGSLDGHHQASEPALAAGLSEIGEETRGAAIENGEAVAARLVAQSTG